MISATITAFIVGALLDLLLGDPRWLPHPIRGIGLLIHTLERLFRPGSPALSFMAVPCRPTVAAVYDRRQSCSSEIAGGHRPPLQSPSATFCTNEKIAGFMLVGLVVLIVLAAVILSLHWGGIPAAAYWIFTCLAVRSLDQESKSVVEALRANDLHRARNLVAFLVGRDTQELSEKEVTRAVFETVAENMSDAIVAPLFYLAIFGVPGMVAYKAVNTMDSMIGYKNDRYIRFGWAAARLDDIVNYVPSRITAGLIVFGAALMRLEWRRAIAVVFRDAHLQPSPNAGYPEAALAGALGVRLGGLNYYFGRPVEKPFLGDPREDLNWSQFSHVRLLLYLVAAVSYLVVGLWLL